MRSIYFLLFFFCALCLQAQSTNLPPGANERSKPNKVEILWDTSLNLGNRDVDSEIQLLNTYFKTLQAVTVTASKFNDAIYESRSFNCPGDCTDLYAFLNSSDYHGASNFAGLLQNNDRKADMAIVFTNGVTLFEPLDSKLNIPVFIVNSKKDAAHSYLYELATATGGSYIDLGRKSVQYALSSLQFDVMDSPISENVNSSEPLYYGVVYHEDKTPIQGAIVRIKNSFNEVQTESNGRYKISARAGDILEISSLGMLTKDTVLTNSKKTHIPMVADGELLDEVLVRQNKTEEERVEEVFGNQKKAAAGYSLNQQFTSKDIRPYHTSLAQILVRMPGVIVEGVDGISEKFVFRKTQNASFLNGGKTYPAIILDGLPIDQSSQRVPFIDPLTIESITLLKSALSTVRYGQIAVYGAIVIELKDYEGNETVTTQNTALVRGNDYSETVTFLAQAEANLPKPKYLLALKESTTFAEARSLYYKQLKYEKDDLNYYLTVAPYFERWNTDFTKDILSNIAVIAPQNTKALKLLAYAYEEINSYENARYIYEQLVNLRPKDLQSYRDLALIYVQTGEYELAATLYRQMLFNTIPNVDFTPVEDIIINEFRNLIMNHKSKINYQGLPTSLLAIDFEIDIRFVLEWNHPATEFEVQIVNPEKKYFSYSHTAFNNKTLLQSEIDNGFFMKEFVIDEGEKGPWIVNIRHSGEHDDMVPLVVKYTQYKNYGTPQETRSVKVIQLDKFGEKLTMDSFVN